MVIQGNDMCATVVASHFCVLSGVWLTMSVRTKKLSLEQRGKIAAAFAHAMTEKVFHEMGRRRGCCQPRQPASWGRVGILAGGT